MPTAVPTKAGRALALLGDHWTLQILQRVFMGERRYHQISAAIHASDAVLSSRLRSLVADQLLVKVPYKDGRTRYEYHLSSAGRATWRIYVAAWAWERQWIKRPAGLSAGLVHTACGHSTVPVLTCGRCDRPVSDRDTSVRRTTNSLSYVGSAARRHIQGRTLQKGDAYSFRPQTLELLGDRWNMALLAAAAIGLRRFSDFERFLGTPPTVLSARLARLVEIGTLRVQELETGRTDYRLTDMGRGFAAILIQIVRWAEEHVRTGEQSSIEIVHESCGRRLLPEYVCAHCQQRLQYREIRFTVLTRPLDEASFATHSE